MVCQSATVTITVIFPHPLVLTGEWNTTRSGGRLASAVHWSAYDQQYVNIGLPHTWSYIVPEALYQRPRDRESTQRQRPGYPAGPRVPQRRNWDPRITCRSSSSSRSSAAEPARHPRCCGGNKNSSSLLLRPHW